MRMRTRQQRVTFLLLKNGREYCIWRSNIWYGKIRHPPFDEEEAEQISHLSSLLALSVRPLHSCIEWGISWWWVVCSRAYQRRRRHRQAGTTLRNNGHPPNESNNNGTFWLIPRRELWKFQSIARSEEILAPCYNWLGRINGMPWLSVVTPIPRRPFVSPNILAGPPCIW